MQCLTKLNLKVQFWVHTTDESRLTHSDNEAKRCDPPIRTFRPSSYGQRGQGYGQWGQKLRPM